MYKGKHEKQNTKAKAIMQKIRVIIIKSITVLMGIIFILSICCLDSDKFYIPLIALIVSGGWFGLIIWANKCFYE